MVRRWFRLGGFLCSVIGVILDRAEPKVLALQNYGDRGKQRNPKFNLVSLSPNEVFVFCVEEELF